MFSQAMSYVIKLFSAFIYFTISPVTWTIWIKSTEIEREILKPSVNCKKKKNFLLEIWQKKLLWLFILFPSRNEIKKSHCYQRSKYPFVNIKMCSEKKKKKAFVHSKKNNQENTVYNLKQITMQISPKYGALIH